jgi:hypothetical protein
MMMIYELRLELGYDCNEVFVSGVIQRESRLSVFRMAFKG